MGREGVRVGEGRGRRGMRGRREGARDGGREGGELW